MNISDVLATSPGPKAYLKGPITVEVFKQDKQLMARDDTGQIALKDWGDEVWRHEGETLTFKGMGIKRGEYKDAPQLQIEWGKTEVTGMASSSQSSEAITIPANASQRGPDTNTRIKAAVAVKLASEDYRAYVVAGIIKKHTEKDEKLWKWNKASLYVRQLNAIEDGKLAPKDDYNAGDPPPEVKEPEPENLEEVEF